MAHSNPHSPTALGGAQRKWLRGQAHALRPIVQVGGSGLSQAVLSAVDQALLAHELIKVRLVQPEDKKAAAQELAERSGAELCGLVGHTVILYRPHPEEPKLELPK
ncbi:MAG: ribosome assembly RNA-binding protein YhbY [Deltaproteobacteria bacterium]|nr:ribosome assembly RNA-binding protein YhbY [Deltaproteobacteria bacterium]MBW2396604.1 ribosome assembly RNA-binding protein YhbY [Deltaproteobacteria bacterium]